MKKILLCFTLLCTTTAVFVTSCKKQEAQTFIGSGKEFGDSETTLKATFDPKFKLGNEGRFLIFKTEQGYQKAIENPDTQDRIDFFARLDELNFDSYYKIVDKDPKLAEKPIFKDDYITRFINKDFIVQVGNYIFKIDPVNERVYALHEDDIQFYTDLVNSNTANSLIKEFSTGDEVIELLKVNGNGSVNRNSAPKLGCNEDGCGGKESISTLLTIPGQSAGYQVWAYNDYNRYGVYFSLAAWVRGSFPRTDGHPYRIYIQCENKWYKPRCRSLVGPESFPWYQDGVAKDNRQKYQSYSSTRPLNGLHLKTRCRLEIDGVPQGGNPYTTVFTEWTRIQVNNPYFP